MGGLNDRFREEFDHDEVPDQWEEIRRRHPRWDRTEPAWKSGPAVAVIALVMAAIGISVAIIAFTGAPGPGTRFGGPPANANVLAGGKDGGTRWEVFVMVTGDGPAIGSTVGQAPEESWRYSVIEEPDPCAIESESINWRYLAQDQDRVVVLQYHVVPVGATSVTFLMTDGRTLKARLLRPPPAMNFPYDAFVIVFDGSPGVAVSEVVIEGKGGERLDDPTRC
jgi:hypothetical protein